MNPSATIPAPSRNTPVSAAVQSPSLDTDDPVFDAPVLLLEDNELVRDALRLYLDRLGIAVTGVASPAELQRTLEAAPTTPRWRVAILDLGLPAVFPVVVRLLRDHGFKGPIVLHTGAMDLQGWESHPEIYCVLRKPVTFAKLPPLLKGMGISGVRTLSHVP